MCSRVLVAVYAQTMFDFSFQVWCWTVFIVWIIAFLTYKSQSDRVAGLQDEWRVAHDVYVPLSYGLGMFVFIKFIRLPGLHTCLVLANWCFRHFFLLQRNHLVACDLVSLVNLAADLWATCVLSGDFGSGGNECALAVTSTSFYYAVKIGVALFIGDWLMLVLLAGWLAQFYALHLQGVDVFGGVPPIRFIAAWGGVFLVSFQAMRAARNRYRLLRRVFGRYVDEKVVDAVLADPERTLAIGGRRRNVVILLSDLRGFSSLMRSMSPEAAIAMMNVYLKTMIALVAEHGGLVDEIIGDALLVVFGNVMGEDGREGEDDVSMHAQAAVRCAAAMQRAMGETESELSMGIGLHCGAVVVGNIGSELRCKFGLIGAPMNMAARIESFSLGGQIIASDAICDAMPPDFPWHLGDSRRVHPKGAPPQGLVISEVVSVDGRAVRSGDSVLNDRGNWVALVAELHSLPAVHLLGGPGKSAVRTFQNVSVAGVRGRGNDLRLRLQFTDQGDWWDPAVLSNADLSLMFAEQAEPVTAKIIRLEPQQSRSKSLVVAITYIGPKERRLLAQWGKKNS